MPSIYLLIHATLLQLQQENILVQSTAKNMNLFTAIRGRNSLLQPPIYTVSSPQTLPKHLVPFTILYQLVVVLLCAKKPTADGGRKGDDDRLIGPGFVLNQYTYVRVYINRYSTCLLYTSPSPRDRQKSRMPSSA